MKVLITSATRREISPFLEMMNESIDTSELKTERSNVKICVSGIGVMSTTYHLCRELQSGAFDLVLNVGICGALDPSLAIGEVVKVKSECLADLGVEQADGTFSDVFEEALLPKDSFPFVDGKLYCKSEYFEQLDLPAVDGITVCKTSGSESSISRIKSNGHEGIESMEGAAVFFTCLQMGVEFCEIRSISNYVVPRDRSNWNIPLAIRQLGIALKEHLP